MPRFSRVAVPALVLAGSLACAHSLFAFSSYGQGAHHNGITQDAAKAKGFVDSTARLLGSMAEQPDWDENSLSFAKQKPIPNALYRASHHFDRNPGVTDSAAFAGGANYMRSQKSETIARLQASQYAQGYQALGRCLHALEDCFSHSNFVDLAAGDQAGVQQAFYDAAKAPPAALRMTGYDGNPAAANDEEPAGDTYPHSKFAKDWHDKNAECQLVIGAQTKFQLARAAAVTAAGNLLDLVRDSVGVAKWDSLRGVVAAPDPEIGDAEWNCAIFCPGSGCDFGCADPDLGRDDLHLTLPPGALGSESLVGLLGVPAHLFQTGDQLIAMDGAHVIPGWEIRLGDFFDEDPLGAQGSADAALPDSTVSAYPGETWGIYFMDETAEKWEPVSGATIDLAGRQVTFPVSATGTYALGHMPAVTAVRVTGLHARAMSDRIELTWRAFLTSPGRFRVLRAGAANSRFVQVGGDLSAAGAEAVLSFLDDGVAPSSDYWYRIAYEEQGHWVESGAIRVRTLAASFALRAVRPNPSRGATQVVFELARSGRAELDVLDAAGRSVRRLVSSDLAAGTHVATWDGSGEGGGPMAAGVYFLRLTSGGQTQSRKVLRLR